MNAQRPRTAQQMKARRITKTPRRAPDFIFLWLTFALAFFGLVMVASASYKVAGDLFGDAFFFARRQAIWLSVGLIVLFAAMNIRLSAFRRITPPFVLASFAALFTVYIPHVGQVLHGSRSWIHIGPLSAQPAELAKPAMVLYLAYLFSKKGERMRDFSRGFLPPFLVVLTFSAIIVLQKDLGTALIIFTTAAVLLFIGGARLIHLGAVVLTAVPLVVMAVVFFPYRMRRITGYLDPWQDPSNSGYQLIQSLLAIAHGQVFGTGIGEGIQNYWYLPFAYNDFIFAVIAEELGLIGTSVFVLVYALWIGRGFMLSLRHPEPHAKLVGMGAMTAVSVQALFNLGGVTGLLPITGVTLPLVSYGGSSLVVTMLFAGWVLSLSRDSNAIDRRPYMIPTKRQTLTHR
ncbi:MAG: putative lipid II flippase FtsW [Hydrogenibacillus sp.]|nr:putative lipid II flippase FtsW [Hydrogenibacillus sp.]